MNNTQISLPYLFTPREYQVPFLNAWDNGCKRLILVGHRRMGKDKMIFAQMAKKMQERVGTYFYFLPTYTQAKKVIWTGADREGFRFLDHFPPQLVRNKNEQEMRIEMKNGSILQLVGADNIDRIVGTNPIGVVFSEYALMKPQVWNMLSPILAENGGWAVFIFTPR
jgi:phage terminase large subunit